MVMAGKKYDVVAITGEYINAQGETKKRYVNCDAVFQTDKANSESRYNALLLWLTIVFFGLVAYAAIGGW